MMTRSQIPALTWWAGVMISACLVLIGAFDIDLSSLPPETPFDNTRSGHAEQWRFLDEASTIVPAGSTFTVDAPEADTEMSLYMMSIGLLPNSTPIPRSYFGTPVAASESARFVLSFGIENTQTNDAVGTTKVAGGFVTDRDVSRR
jgi:hypothetical protein